MHTAAFCKATARPTRHEVAVSTQQSAQTGAPAHHCLNVWMASESSFWN